MANVFTEERQVVYHSVLGILMGVAASKLCRLTHDAIHDAFPEDGPVVAATSLGIQFVIIMTIMLIAVHTLPAFKKDLGMPLPPIIWSTWYFGAQIFFYDELGKLIRGEYD
jgi:hypothetical protein